MAGRAGEGGPPPGVALVLGAGVAGEATARRLLERGWTVTVVDDGRVAPARAAELRARGARLLERVGERDRADASGVADLVDAATLVVPSPGVPWGHEAFVRARSRGVPCWSELELAAHWTDLPMVAVTGTNGKTTVTELVTRMLMADGRQALSAGNNELPLVDAIAVPGLDVVVVEASSFRLQLTETWRPVVGTWLNLAEDHLDWHPTMAHYARAKARIWAAQRSDDVAVANAEDPVVAAAVRSAPSRPVTFGLDHGDWRVLDGALTQTGTAGARRLMAVDELWRSLPHDVVDALAAAATAVEAGVDPETVVEVLRSFGGLPHRVSLVGEHGGVRFVDDSKATDPHATLAALSSFDSVVLIAGGRNKGLDLTVLRGAASHLRSVVAIGEAAPDLVEVFEGAVPVSTATSMDEAVALAGARAVPGDVVLLSPACASFDWYRSYAERGDDFARAVGARAARGADQ